MNYTTKKTSCEVNSTHTIYNNHNLINNFNQSSSKKEEKSSAFSLSGDALLGNREIGFLENKFSNIYKKYLRKQISQYALTVENTKEFISKTNEHRKVNRKIDFNAKLSFSETLKTINKTLCSCGRDVHFMNDKKIVDIKESGSTRRLKGLKSCGNNSACPVCAAKLSAIRGNQLKELMTAGRKNNRSYMMVVATIPHTPGEQLEITLNQVIDMSRYIHRHKDFVKFKKLTKCRFVHGGLENMVSFKNGLVDWHPHKNYLLDFDISVPEIIGIMGLDTELELRFYVSKLLTELGQKYLDFKKIDKKLLSPFLKQDRKTKRIHVKSGVSASLEFNDEYISKWGLDSELTSGIYKDGKNSDSFHPFNLLDFIYNENTKTTKEQKYQCIKAFQQFVVASKGKWWFYFGRGAIAFYNENYNTELKVKKDEDELLALEDDGELIYFLEHQEWLDFKPTPKKIGYALSLPTRQQVLEYIYEHIESNRIKFNEAEFGSIKIE